MIFTNIAYASEGEETQNTETSTEGGVLSSLGISPGLFISQLINFTLIFLIVWFLILKPLTKKMTERQKMIDDSIDNAKKIQENLTRSEKDYQTRIDQAKVEANKIMDRAVTEAGQASEEAKNNAKKEIERLVSQARESIKVEKENMNTELKEETVNFLALALEKILGEKMTAAADKKMIEEILKKLK